MQKVVHILNTRRSISQKTKKRLASCNASPLTPTYPQKCHRSPRTRVPSVSVKSGVFFAMLEFEFQ